MRHSSILAAVVLALVELLAPHAGRAGEASDAPADWPFTEGAAGGGRYSPLRDIDRTNVGDLEIAWTYRHGDFGEGPFPFRINKGTSFESTPIVIDRRLIFTTPYSRVIALDPESGAELWTFDPKIDRSRFYANMMINRGVAYWRSSNESGHCNRRVFLATLDARLIALDAVNGKPCADFGAAGTVDLLADLAPVIDSWEYNVTSPGTVVGDVIIVGSSIADTIRPAAPPGDVRAFDVHTGKRVWTFHTIPRPGEPGAETWGAETKRTGAANVWSTITADLARGWVFLPVSTPSPDFDGVDRPGANLYSDSVVALEAATGRRVWSYQTVHHDLWDYDLAAPPVLVRVVHEGRPIDAVAQATKTGFVFLLDRETGTPLFPIEERSVSASDVPGEHAWPTQPIPAKPPPLVPQRLTENDLYAHSPEHLRACREQLAALRNDGLFTPPSVRGSLLYPYTAGGANWSGAAFDPDHRVLVVPVNNLAHIAQLTPLPESNLSSDTAQPLRGGLRGLWFLLTGRGTGLRYFTSPRTGRTLFAHGGVPCNAPPWGLLVAVDLDSGAIRWSVPTGVAEDGTRGLSGFGPPLVTAGGLVFHGGTRESLFRAYDVDSGAVLRTLDLPAGLHAGPITYRTKPGGKQYLVIAPGGHVGLGSALGDYVIAYTLPTMAR
jgi:quinoprotein glucose dehydrogenase